MKRIIVISALLSALLLLLGGCGKDQIPETTEAETAAPVQTETAPPVIEYKEFEDSYTDRLPEKAADGLTLHAFNWTYHEILINLENIRTLPFDDARKELMRICGVGPKVADCVLLFGMYRTEAFPVDVWMKRVMARFYPDGMPECASGIEGIAQQYLFHYVRSDPSLLSEIS